MCACVLVSALPLCSCSNDSDERRTEYEITAILDAEKKTAKVEQTVDYYNSTEVVLDEVCFHLYPSAFREGARFCPVPESMREGAYVGDDDYGGIEITSVAVCGEKQTASVEGQDEDILVVNIGTLQPSESIEIFIEYNLDIPAVRHRFGYLGQTINLGNFYPIACVFEDGNFVTSPYYENGDPFYSDVADYDVTIIVPEQYSVAMTGGGEKTECDGGNAAYRSQIKKVRDFAIVCGQMSAVEKNVNGVKVSYMYTTDNDPQGTLSAACDAIRTFSSMIGKYPYSSYTVVQTAFLHGGMEYPTLSMISDKTDGEVKKEVVIHETAHQWWYGVVGNDEVKYPWLDEGLTEYTTSLFYRENPSYGVSFDARIADALGSFVLYSEASGNGNSAMTRSLGEYSSPFEYSYMTYVKGELMFSSLHSLLGDEAFFSGLKKYYDECAYKNARPDDLIGAFERSGKKELKSFFDSWLDGKVKLYGGSGL